MYTVSVQAHYDAAHFLRNYKGKCERLHGHRYVVEVALQTEELNEAGIAFDFVDLKRELRELADGLLYARVWETPTQWAQYGPAAAGVPAHRSPSMGG